MECVSFVEYTLLVNGCMTQSFTPSKRLRQGDPISPYLFLMCANVLSIALLKVEQNKDLQGIKVGRNGCSFTHLLFSDDSLFFFKNDNKSLLTLQHTLQQYCSLSEQSINFIKSDLFCSPNMPSEDQSNLARLFQVKLVQAPSKYLGLDIKLKGKRVSDLKFLEDKLLSELQGWKARLLSKQEGVLLLNLSSNLFPCTPSLTSKSLILHVGIQTLL